MSDQAKINIWWLDDAERCDLDAAPDPDDDVIFLAERLHERSRFGWAVTGRPSGAIVRRSDDVLLMRLREAEARRMADAMTRDRAASTMRH